MQALFSCLHLSGLPVQHPVPLCPKDEVLIPQIFQAGKGLAYDHFQLDEFIVGISWTP